MVVIGGQLFQAAVDVLDDLGDGDKPLSGTPLADGVDALFRRLQNLLAGTFLPLDHPQNVVHGLGDLAHEGAVSDNFDVLLHIGRRGGHVHQLQHVVPRGGLVQVALQPHLFQHCHRVDDLGVAEHGVDGAEKGLILLLIEVLCLQRLNDLGDAVTVDEHTAQYRVFCLQRVGRLSVEKFFLHGVHLLLTSKGVGRAPATERKERHIGRRRPMVCCADRKRRRGLCGGAGETLP